MPAVESACRYCPLVPTPSLPTVSAAVPTTKSPLASTTSAQLAGVISDETGTGALVFGNAPTLKNVVVASDGTTDGNIQLNCTVNSHGQKIQAQTHAQAATNTLLLPGGTTIGNANAVLVSDTGTQTLTNKTLTSAVLTGTLTAGGGVGTNGQVLTSTGTGVQYATPSAGGTDEQLIVMQAL